MDAVTSEARWTCRPHTATAARDDKALAVKPLAAESSPSTHATESRSDCMLAEFVTCGREPITSDVGAS